MIQTKTCPRCREGKPAAAFQRDKSRSDGLQSWCRKCKKQNYYENHSHYKQKRHARYRAANPVKPKEKLAASADPGTTTLCEPCANGVPTMCEFFRTKDKEQGLAAMGVSSGDYTAHRVAGDIDVYRVTRCPNFKPGPLPPLARRA